MKRWSFVYYAAMLLCLAASHVLHEKPVHVTTALVTLVSAAFFYCRYAPEFPVVGLEEIVFAASTGPIAMYSTAYFVVGEVPWAVVFYALPVTNFTLSFLVSGSCPYVA